MAKDKNLVTVIAIVDYQDGERATLWGVNFVLVDGYYEAELPKDEAKLMVEAGRVSIK